MVANNRRLTMVDVENNDLSQAAVFPPPSQSSRLSKACRRGFTAFTETRLHRAFTETRLHRFTELSEFRDKASQSFHGDEASQSFHRDEVIIHHSGDRMIGYKYDKAWLANSPHSDVIYLLHW